MSYTTKIYGASDDLIEVEGCKEGDELGGGDAKKFLGFSNGTVLSIHYDDRGVWSINVVTEGEGKHEKLFGLPDDAAASQHHIDEDAPKYSDVLRIITPTKIELTYKGSKKPAPPHPGLPTARKVIAFLDNRKGFEEFWYDVDEDSRNEILEGIAKIVTP